jgi:hypothetical protein
MRTPSCLKVLAQKETVQAAVVVAVVAVVVVA